MASSSNVEPLENPNDTQPPTKMEEDGAGGALPTATDSAGSTGNGLLKGDETIPPLLSGSAIENDPVLAALRKYKDAAGSSFHPASEVAQEQAQEPPSFVRGSAVSAADSAVSIEDEGITAMCGGACATDGRDQSWNPLTWFLQTALGLQVKEACCDAHPPAQMGSTYEEEEEMPARGNAVMVAHGQGQLEMALGVFCSTHHELAARSQLVPTGAPGRYFINGSDVQLGLINDTMVVLQDDTATGEQLPPVPLFDYLNSGSAPMQPQSLGPLGMTQAPRTYNPPSMGTVKELPPGFSSATYDELDDDAKRALFCRDSLPNPAEAEVLELGEVLSPPGPEGCLACLRRACISGLTGGPTPLQAKAEVLVSELALAPPLNETQEKALHKALLQYSVVSNLEVAASLGVAKQRSAGGGVWVVYSAPSVPGMQPVVVNAGTEVGPEASHSLLKWRVATAQAVAEVLTRMHASGVCHGSLSPRCVLATSPSDISTCSKVDVHISEVGLVDALLESKVLKEHELLRLGPDYARYLAPEAAFDLPRSAGPAADVWAFAQLLLFLFGWGAPHAECTTVQKLSSKVLPRRKQRSNVPDMVFPGLPELHSIVLRCLSPEPSGRPEAWEVLEVLNACNLQEPSQSSGVFTPAPAKSSGPDQSPGKSSASSFDEAGTGAAPSPGSPGRLSDPDSPQVQGDAPEPASTGGSPTLESTGATPVGAPQSAPQMVQQSGPQPKAGFVHNGLQQPQPGRAPQMAPQNRGLTAPQGLTVVPLQSAAQPQMRGMTLVQH